METEIFDKNTQPHAQVQVQRRMRLLAGANRQKGAPTPRAEQALAQSWECEHPSIWRPNHLTLLTLDLAPATHTHTATQSAQKSEVRICCASPTSSSNLPKQTWTEPTGPVWGLCQWVAVLLSLCSLMSVTSIPVSLMLGLSVCFYDTLGWTKILFFS